ncbi:MAG: hypothetical protein AB7U62_10040 [Pseudolabrys sp.]
MPRDIPLELENSFDDQVSADAAIQALTIVHPSLSDPVRAVSSPFGDNVGDHFIGPQRYYGIPFKLVIVSDDDRPPRGTLELFNYGQIAGRAVRAMKSRCRVTIEMYAAADFTVEMSGDPPAHQPIGTPRRIYRAAWLTLVNVSGQTWITGDIASYGADLSVEPVSPVRATQDILPGLFR